MTKPFLRAFGYLCAKSHAKDRRRVIRGMAIDLYLRTLRFAVADMKRGRPSPYTSTLHDFELNLREMAKFGRVHVVISRGVQQYEVNPADFLRWNY